MKIFFYLLLGFILNNSIHYPVQAESRDSLPISPRQNPSNSPQQLQVNSNFGFPTPRNSVRKLITRPATIHNSWKISPWRPQNQPNHLNLQSNTIPLIRHDGCRNFDAVELINDPSSITTVIKKCEEEKLSNIEPPNRTEQLEYFKVPTLDSGMKLQVTEF